MQAQEQLQKIGVIGLGLLGADIVALILSRGLKVVAADLDSDARQQLPQRVSTALSELIEHGGAKQDDFDGWQDRLQVENSCAEFQDCDFIIESVAEDAKIKAAVFSSIEEVVNADTPVSTNTSGLPLSDFQQQLKHPDRFLGMHFCQPAYAQPFMEIIRGEQTNDSTFGAAHRLGLMLGKEPCLINRDLPGFVVNRIGYAMYREAANLVAEGVSDFASIDNAVRNTLGVFMSMTGPFRWMDISGGPALYGRAMKTIWPTLDNSDSPPEFIQEMIDQNDRGAVSGKGFYDYQSGDGELWDKAFRQHVWKLLKLRHEEESQDDFPDQ
ncbi:MAG: 3-hydroxyacyl-CoA dehydrogenase family protein [Verrucomicrobiota bacterium]